MVALILMDGECVLLTRTTKQTKHWQKHAAEKPSVRGLGNNTNWPKFDYIATNESSNVRLMNDVIDFTGKAEYVGY
jgi:hypothetical protein